MNEEKNILPEKSKEENSLPEKQVVNSEKVNENILLGGQEGSQQHDELTSGTANKTSEIKNMEVHHHHPHAHHSKKWKDYLYEFFMLFLAVTAGFFIENLREHYVEHQRAKIYTTNMIKELESDTLEISRTILIVKKNAANIDSFILVQSQENDKAVTNGKLYYFADYTRRINLFTPSNATLEQLKSSGNLRYFEPEIVNRISDYDLALRNLGTEYAFATLEYEKVATLRYQIFDGLVLNKLHQDHTASFRDSFLRSNPPLANDDPHLLKEFTGFVEWTNNNYGNYEVNHYLIPLKEKAITLIDLLRKEYDL